jgi:hypothetical protein
MNNYTIMTPFTLDWRLVAPRDYETLEYFMTPDLSFVFHKITNGKADFHIGSFFLNPVERPNIPPTPLHPDKFLREIMPQRSQERITEAFRTGEISAFFTLTEAEILENMFKENGFICRKVEILYRGSKVTLSDLPPEEFSKMIKECARLHMMIPIDLEHDGHVMENIFDDVQEKVSRRVLKEQADRDAARRGMTKKRLTLRCLLSGALLAASTASFAFGRKFFSKGTKLGLLGGVGCSILSMVTGILGKKLAEEAVDYFRKGMIAAYA